jgi:carboxymethylenebutenolidase
MKTTSKRIRIAAVSAVFYTVFLLGFGTASAAGLPPGEADSKTRLLNSPRHGEWVSIDAGGGDMVDLWVVYPERKDPAPVVIVIQEIFGLTDWIRAVADQLAADGFIAVAPDFLSGKGPGGKGSGSVDVDTARTLVRELEGAEITSRLDAAARYATALPAAKKRFATVGFCWGGAVSFGYATQRPGLGAAVVYYGTSPATDTLAGTKAPVLGLYGGDDARVNATIPDAEKEMKRLRKRFEYEIYDGAGHGFLRAQDGREGANMRATQKAWPRTVEFLKKALEK